MNRGTLMWMQKLDGVFDGDDVMCLLFIDLVEDRCERGGFAASSGACDENNSASQIRSFANLRRQAERFEIGNGAGNDAHHDGAGAALGEDVDAKARNFGKAVGDIAGALLFKFLERHRVAAD